MHEFFGKTTSLHHAYIIEGGKDHVTPELVSFLEKTHNVIIQGNPDFLQKDFETLGIDDARALKEMQGRKGIEGGKKIFIFSAITITEEAQNALLKIFEEPTVGTHFFLIIPSLARITPTLLSRAIVVKTNQASKSYDILLRSKTTDGQVSYEKTIEQFLTSSPQKRLALIANFVEEKNKGEATLFLNALEKNLFENMNSKDRKSVV